MNCCANETDLSRDTHTLSFNCKDLVDKFIRSGDRNTFETELEELLLSNEYELPLEDCTSYGGSPEMGHFGPWKTAEDGDNIVIACIVYFSEIVATGCPDKPQDVSASGEFTIRIKNSTGEIQIITEQETIYD